MTDNSELIEQSRVKCFKKHMSHQVCSECQLRDALEAADKRIAELEKQIGSLCVYRDQQVAEIERLRAVVDAAKKVPYIQGVPGIVELQEAIRNVVEKDNG